MTSYIAELTPVNLSKASKSRRKDQDQSSDEGLKQEEIDAIA